MKEPQPNALGLLPSQRRPEIPGGGPQNVVEILDPIVASHPEREALVGRSGRFSFAELDREANRAAHALAGLGIGPGDRVAACLPNDVDIALAFLGTQRLGAIWVGVNRPLAPPEKAYILGDSGARVLLATPEVAAELAPHRGDLDGLREVLVSDPSSPDCAFAAARRSASSGRPDHAPDAFAPAAIAYTSGTTGHPKGAVHSQHNMVLVAAEQHFSQRRAPDLRQGAVLPLTILNLIILEALAPWYDGRCLVCVDRIDAEGLAEWVRRERVGRFSGVPTIFHDLLTNPNVKEEDLVSLVEPGMGGANVPPETVALYEQRFGKAVTIGYGMTEAPTAVTWSGGEVPESPGLCGRPVPQVRIEVLDEEGKPVPQGEVGEICVGSALEGRYAGVYTPMLGYWRRPEATLEALRGGLYHTGDLGLFGRDGNLYIRGRRNELILRGGANVYPAEVERVLQEQPGVAFAAVLGVPDGRLGERVVAVVQPEPGAAPEPEALREAVRAELARYKVPDAIALADELPRNAMGKVIKRELAPLFDGAAVRG